MAARNTPISISSDLEQFFREKENSRKNLIIELMVQFQQDISIIAAFRTSENSNKLVAWIISHPMCISLLKSCLETNGGRSILEKIRATALNVCGGHTKINTEEGKFFQAWMNGDKVGGYLLEDPTAPENRYSSGHALHREDLKSQEDKISRLEQELKNKAVKMDQLKVEVSKLEEKLKIEKKHCAKVAIKENERKIKELEEQIRKDKQILGENVSTLRGLALHTKEEDDTRSSSDAYHRPSSKNEMCMDP